MGLSSFASKAVEDVVAANPQTFFQTYWCGTRDRLLERLERARRAGVAGLIVTLDWSFSHARDWGSPFIPERLDLRAVARYAPEALRRPRWLAAWAKSGSPPDLTVPNMAIAGRAHSDVLRRLRRVDADTTTVMGRPALVAGSVGRTVHGQRDHAAR